MKKWIFQYFWKKSQKMTFWKKFLRLFKIFEKYKNPSFWKTSIIPQPQHFFESSQKVPFQHFFKKSQKYFFFKNLKNTNISSKNKYVDIFFHFTIEKRQFLFFLGWSVWLWLLLNVRKALQIFKTKNFFFFEDLNYLNPNLNTFFIFKKFPKITFSTNFQNIVSTPTSTLFPKMNFWRFLKNIVSPSFPLFCKNR